MEKDPSKRSGLEAVNPRAPQDIIDATVSGFLDLNIERARKLAETLSETRKLNELRLKQIEQAQEALRRAKEDINEREGLFNGFEKLKFIFDKFTDQPTVTDKLEETRALIDSTLGKLNARERELKALIEKYRPVARGGIARPFRPTCHALQKAVSGGRARSRSAA